MDRLIKDSSDNQRIKAKIKSDLKPEVTTLHQNKKQTETRIQRTIDLHGFNRVEADRALRNFVLESQKKGLKKLLVITGKGYSSPNKKSVIREDTRYFLERDDYDMIQSFQVADNKYGGTGAFMVTLK